VEVFDLRTKRLLAPIKVGQLPHSLAFATDGITMYVANSGGETISIVDLDRGAQTGLVRFSPLPFNSNVALVTAKPDRLRTARPSGGDEQRQAVESGRNQVLPRTLNTAVFGNLQTLPGPQTMASSAGGEFIFLLDAGGTGYLYDASVDEWVIGRQLFGNANQPLCRPLPLFRSGCGRTARQYFLANGLVFQSVIDADRVGDRCRRNRPFLFAVERPRWFRFRRFSRRATPRSPDSCSRCRIRLPLSQASKS